jgi:2-polyprenyl-3-methyl-5-hydroxy-6-metoxy-1,4-benzoquinol methylase
MDASLTTPAMPLPLDLACGEGRNAVRLAEQGWTVTGVDSSDVGLDDARRMAAARGAVVERVLADSDRQVLDCLVRVRR